MNTRTVNLDTYSLSLLTAKEDIFNPRSSTDWALFVYDGVSNKLKLADSGAGGVAELASKFHASKPQYGLCRMKGPDNASPRTALIIWVGQNVDDYRRTECANHVPAIKNFFKEAHVFLQAESAEEVTEERIRTELSKAHTNSSTQWLRRSSRSMDREDIVGTNYRKTNAAMEMRLLNRDSFWARAEREEEERKEEDRRKAAEERRRLERERAAKERQEADERDRRMNEKLKTIEEQRRRAAEQEEELRKQEKLKWEQQKREHEEEMRARLKRSESIEKAAEAAALVSQRTMNPREFFRQLSSSSSLSPTSPSRSGKPFRRYQRSLTDTAFIFSKAEESAASSPRSSPLVSPFSRAPPSPFNRAASPPTSPVFRASTSPQRAPLSPPLSPLRPAPPTSSLPNVPTANLQIKGRAQSPTGPSAPPASPTLLAPSAEGAPGSPSSLAERSAFTFEPSLSPPSSRASLPDQPISAAELASEISYKVQTVLVEEDEEEEEKEEENIKDEESEVTQSEPQADPQETKERNTFKSEPQTKEEEEEALEEEDVKEEERNTSPAPASAVEEQHQTAERSEENEGAQEPLDQTEDAEETLVAEEEEQRPREEGEAVGFETEEDAEQEESEEMITEEEPAHSDLSPHEPAPTQHEDALLITDPDPEESCEITRVTEELPIKLITNGNTQQHNGTDHSLSPSDPELDSPELAVYCTVEDEEEDDICIEKYIKISENGDEVLTEPQVCVRALYDYQAEDESELSFELGDIIRDVEAVDKGWWRGWSQDGRQGLFPANYVEPISPQ